MKLLTRAIDWVREKNHARLARRRGIRPATPEFPSGYQKAQPAAAPSRQEWDALIEARRARSTAAEPTVDVIVPVYRGLAMTLRCLYSVLTSVNDTAHSLLVIDDASPEPLLVDELRRLAGAGLFELLENERNLGFVATCNRGMTLHPHRDVVLLNSDTEVYGNWLDRLRAAALREKRIGSVTPLSNNATICSYPYFVRDNDMALELDHADLDRLAAKVNAGRSCPAPTGVGFCMYVRRACLDEVGLFDVERFGRGYGEENDFCLRASERGWLHLIAFDVFVRHFGAASFGHERDARQEHALAEIAKRFPDYASDVARFVESDPPREARARLDLARLAERSSGAAVLFVTHDWGGGIAHHIEDLSRRLETENVASFLLRAEPGQERRAVLSHPSVWPTPNLGPFEVGEDGVEPLAEVLRTLRVRHLHVHSLVGFDQPTAAQWIPRVARAIGARYDFTVHDYLCICPRTNLVDGSGSYCGEPGLEACERCLIQNGSPFGRAALQQWRDAYHRLLLGARIVIVPGQDVAQRVAGYLPGVEPTARAHAEDPVALSVGAPQARARKDGEPLRVAVIGAIHPHKGLNVLRECARDAARRRLPIAFVVVGYSTDDRGLGAWGNVEILGRYEPHELPRLLAAQGCQCALFPSVCPETYCYTLSAAIAAGLHPVSFDLGVQAERIRSLAWGTLIPAGASASAVNDALLAAGLQGGPDPQRVRAQFPVYQSVIRDYYGLGDQFPPTGSSAA